MISEERKKVFLDSLNNVFNKTITKNKETYQKTSQWLKNLYYRYINKTLSKEHVEVFENGLAKRNISIEEFLETKGSIDVLQELAKSKKIQKNIEKAIDVIKPKKKEKSEVKEESIEDLKKQRDKLEKSINTLKSKITKRNRSLYKLTDEACEEIEKQIAEGEKEVKKLTKKIDKLSQPVIDEVKESESSQKKIEELLNENKQKDATIASMQKEISNYEAERKNYSTKYREEYERKYETYSKQLKEEYDEKLSKEIDKQINKANHQDEKTIELQKAHILKMLLKNDSVNIEEIKSNLENHKVSTKGLDIAINELRTMIPGIIKYYDINEETTVFSINANALNRWDALEENQISPRISNVFDGEVFFIEHSDLHLDLKITEDKLKKAFEPTFNFVINNGNNTIINLGDLADTLKEIDYTKWENKDKEAIELAIKFYKNFAKVLATVPNLKYYFLQGNHEKHAYIAGIDPLEIMSDYCDNLISLGANQGSFRIGNDKIGVFHDLDTSGIASAIQKAQELSQDCIYSLIAHYHLGINKPLIGCSLVKNGIDNPRGYQAILKDGKVIFLNVKQLISKDNKIVCLNQTKTEIYNSEYQYIKK